MKKALLAILLFLLGFSAAQAQLTSKKTSFSSKTDWEERLGKAVLDSIKKRQNYQTVEYVQAAMEAGKAVDSCVLSAIVADSVYMRSLDDEELGTLAEALAQADLSTGCGMQIALTAQNALEKASLDEEDPSFPLNLFYETSLVLLAGQENMTPVILNWAFEKTEQESSRILDVKSAPWASLVLLTLAGEEEPNFNRREFEKRLEEIIPQFDWLKDADADYLTRLGHIKSGKVWHKSNQSVMLSLFAQANSFFSLKDDEGFLSGMASTGGLNSLGRKEADPRFSDDGEIFYLHHPTPGTDGSGHFADSPNGRKHQVLAQLIWALATSYSTRSDAQQACWLMERFVKPYLAIANDEFKHYLYIPLQAMRAGKETLNLSNIHGWDEQEKDLQKELYDNLKDKYGIYVGVTALQGAAEVAAEWEVIGGVFKVIGKGFKLAGKGIGKAWVKYMPKRTRVVLRQNIVDPWRKLRGKPTRAQVKGAQRVAQDVAQEERALAVQYRLGDLTEEEYSAALESLRKEQARQLAVRGLAH